MLLDSPGACPCPDLPARGPDGRPAGGVGDRASGRARLADTYRAVDALQPLLVTGSLIKPVKRELLRSCPNHARLQRRDERCGKRLLVPVNCKGMCELFR